MNQLKPFIPPLLPPKLDLSGLIRLVSEAKEAVVRYDESVRRLPNPELIKHSFATQEAVLSSRIEGIQATLREVLAYDVANQIEELTEIQKDYREIVNYREAISYGRQLLDDQDFSVGLIKELHALLLKSVRGQDKGPGQLRKHQVYIGRPGATINEARYIPPPYQQVVPLLENLVTFTTTDSQDFDALIVAGILHYQFEAIHPFSDGNGRIGRLLITLYLYKQKLTAYPNLYVSEFFEHYRREYYDALNEVSKSQDWLGWISLFLLAARQQAKVSKQRVDKIHDLYKEIKDQLPTINSKYGSAFLEAMFKKPIVDAETLGVQAQIKSHQTTLNLISKFEKLGYLEIGRGIPGRPRKRLVIFSKLLDVLNS